MQKRAVHILTRHLVFLFLCLFAVAVRADVITLHPTGGETVTGEMMTPDEKGVVLKRSDGSYSDPIPWGKLTQEDLVNVVQQEPRARQYAEPFIEISRDEKRQRTAVEIKPVPRLERPAGHSFLGALFGSSLGVFAVLLIYAGNIYAAYEISIFRARPAGLVCGVSAVAPIVGPILFLSMPTQLRGAESAAPAADAGLEAAIAAEEQTAPAEAREHKAATQQHQHAPASNLPPTKTFMRGQFTFNRRFFETQVPGFFAVVRPEADKEMTLIFKSARGTHSAQRISRVTPNEIYITVQKGSASEDIILPFVEIQEVILKHRDA